MHVQMVTLMVTSGSVDQSPIYKSDLWLVVLRRRSAVRGIYQWGSVYFRIPRAELFISGDPFISGFPGPIQRVLWLSVHRISGDDGDVSFRSVYFGTPKSDL